MKKTFVIAAGLLVLSFATALGVMGDQSAQSQASDWRALIVLIPVIGLCIYFMVANRNARKKKQP